MTWALAALMVAVALEAAVIAGLVLRLRAHASSEPQTDNQRKG